VLGTARLIRLALHGRRKRFDDVSTLGVLAGARGPGGVLEQDGVAALQAAWPAKGGYAHGYAASKWAAEVLLRELHQRFQAPVRVFRPGMILPDRRYRGQVNAPDMLSRLLASVAATGLAPRSFYAGPAPAQYDGLPVDFVAAAMVALSSAWGEGLATYHMSNPHGDDAVSLDTLMDWVASAGIPIRRVDDHAAWFEAFSARLGALPPEARQRSAWPVREAWARPAGDPAAGRADAGRFIAEVRRLKPGGEPGLPRLTEDYVHRYLEDLQALDLLQSS